jgi:phage shock protein A
LFEAYTKFAAGNLTERDMLLKLVHGEALSAAGMQQSIQQLYERMERLHQKIDRIEKKIGSVPAK